MGGARLLTLLQLFALLALPRLAVAAPTPAAEPFPSTARGTARGTAGSAADAWELHRALLASPRLELVVAANDGIGAQELDELMRRLLAEGPWSAVDVTPAGEARKSDAPRLVLATTTDPAAAAWLEAGQVRVLDAGFRHAGNTWNGAGDVLVAVFEDPQRPGRPLTLVCANEPQALLDRLTEVELGWRPSWRAWRAGELFAWGALRSSGAPLEGTQSTAVQERARRAVDGELRSFPDAGLRLDLPARGIPSERVESYARRAGATRARLLAWAGADTGPAATAMVHRDPAAMRAIAGAQDLGLAPAGGERVHVLLHPGHSGASTSDAGAADAVDSGSGAARSGGAGLERVDDGGAAAATWLARELLGRPRAAWTADAAGIAASGAWWGRPLDAWAARLAAAELVPPLAELCDAALDGERSPHVHRPLRALLLTVALENGAELQEFWGTGLDPEDAALARAFDARLAAARATHDGPRAAERAERRAAALAAPLRRGVNLVRTEREPATAYGSPLAAESLAAAAALGANAVALRVSYALDPGVASEWAPTLPGGLRASETDLELAAGVADAAREGLRALLVPEVLTRPWGTLAGARVLPTAEATGVIFDGLERGVLHAALVAELAGCEVLALAEDLPPLSQTGTPEGASEGLAAIQTLKRERWAQLIARASAAYSGPLTYAAHWAGDRPPFAEELAFSGANLFRPLAGSPAASKGPRPGLREAAAALRKQLRYALLPSGRPPLLVTGVGFASTEFAWLQPFAPTGALDMEEQEQLYRALLQVLTAELERGVPLAGFYLWYWSTDPAQGGRSDRGFTPRGKPAEALLGELFALER